MTKKLKPQKGNHGSKSGALTTADLIVLSLLEERAMNGYELTGEYERQEVADWASVSKAQVYYALQKLLKRTMIAAITQTEGDVARDRTVYEPTKLGRKELARSLVQQQWAHMRVAQPFSTWLGLSIHLNSDEVRKMLMARKAFLQLEIEREKASLKFIKTLTSDRAKAGQLIVDLVIRQFEVELEWASKLLKN